MNIENTLKRINIVTENKNKLNKIWTEKLLNKSLLKFFTSRKIEHLMGDAIVEGKSFFELKIINNVDEEYDTYSMITQITRYGIGLKIFMSRIEKSYLTHYLKDDANREEINNIISKSEAVQRLINYFTKANFKVENGVNESSEYFIRIYIK